MESTVRSTKDEDNIVTIWIDVPGKSVNTISPQVIADLTAMVSAVEAGAPAGVVFASGKKDSFIAGADLFEIRKMDRDQVTRFLQDGQRLFHQVAAMTAPTVAAINGDCLGGGLELSLACKYRVATESLTSNIGLPETKLGILPAWGGTTRLPRLIGLEEALPLLLTGKTLPPKKAMRVGIVDEVVRPEALAAACKRVVLAHGERHGVSWTERVAAATPFIRNRILATAEAKTRQKTYDHYPAPLKLIEVIRKGYDVNMEAGFKAEVEGLVSLMEGDTARNLMRLFFLRQGAKKSIAQKVAAKPAPVNYAAVIGGGTMGAGIVYSLARAGINVRLIEVNAEAASAGLNRVQQVLNEDVAAGRLTDLAARDTMNRVAPSIEWAGLELADLVIEAVVERMDVKREVFKKLDAVTRPDCVLATNTSSLKVTEMAQSTAHPQRVVGLHFFNPVPKMPLVEVVRTAHCGDQALATAIGLAIKVGKTPVLVNDAPGFLVNRVLIPYLAEAIFAGQDGIPIPVIDAAMRRWGMPMGPFELLDEIGLDVTALILDTLAGPLAGRVSAPVAIKTAIEKRWLGKKTQKGFYIYAQGDPKAQADLNQEMAALLYPAGATASDKAVSANADKAGTAETETASQAAAAREEEVQWRLALPMVNEAARLLAEGVVDSTDAIDLATVLGTGFAPFRGGLAHFADAVGSEALVSRMNELAARHGERFKPAGLLVDLAAAHRPLSEFAALGHSTPAATAAGQPVASPQA